MSDENGIDIITHFVTHPHLNGTFYPTKFSKFPIGYFICKNRDYFVAFLRNQHSRQIPRKEEATLFSPAIFDPNHPNAEEGKKRGLKNIVIMRHLWMDFENGDLRPEDVAELFPRTRLVIFNTYGHTIAMPRFRVVFPFDEPISADDYEILYDNIIAKIRDAGYSVGQPKEERIPRSGLDLSKKSPASLFHLPCQAEDPSQSFFFDYNDSQRKPLNPSKWIKNNIIFLQQGRPRQYYSREEINEAAVDAATATWRASANYPGTGNAAFFQYAVALRSAGMSLAGIECKLTEECHLGRSPDERKQQIRSIMSSLGYSNRKAG